MDKLRTLAYQYFWLIVLVGVLLIGASIFWGYGKYLEHQVDSQVHANQTAAQTAVNSAVTSENQAANVSIERRTEDSIRDKTIRPKLDQSRRNSQASKTELEKARQNFNEKAIPSSSSRADNCVRLDRLYANTRFEYCGQ